MWFLFAEEAAQNCAEMAREIVARWYVESQLCLLLYTHYMCIFSSMWVTSLVLGDSTYTPVQVLSWIIEHRECSIIHGSTHNSLFLALFPDRSHRQYFITSSIEYGGGRPGRSGHV